MKKTFVILGVVLTISLIGFASRRLTPPSKGDLVGFWIGYEQSFPYFYRLNLREDYTGTLVILYPEGNPSIYGLRWEFPEPRLLIQVSPMSQGAEKITCSVTKVDYRSINLVITGSSNQWKRTALLLNEKQLSAKIAESAEHERKEEAKRMGKP